MNALLLAEILRTPARAETLSADEWNAVLTMARGELLLGTLAHRLEGIAVPETVARILADGRIDADNARRGALFEAMMTARALSAIDTPIVLLKGTAYVAAGLNAGRGRHIGDTDILVPKEALPAVETALLGQGWEWVKDDPYDHAYYMQWMHELPPLIHRGRDRMADVHHTILPLTHRLTPNAEALLGSARPLEGMAGLAVLSPTDMVCHCAAHLIADGDLAGGMRNLWDFHSLCSEFAAADPDFWSALRFRAGVHDLCDPVARAARLAHALYGTDVPVEQRTLTMADRWFLTCLTARDGEGRDGRKGVRFAFYLRSHWMRMPPMMLARHLWTKWRKG